MNERIIEDITNFIFVDDEIDKSDVIFLPGGAHAELPEKGASLYLDGFADYVIPSGKYSIGSGAFAGVQSKANIYNGNYPTECDFYTDVLLRSGVRRESILREDRAEFTKQNADFSRIICDENNIYPKRAIICCKSFHARRCLMYYGFAFPKTELLICPVDCMGMNRDNWFESEHGFETVIGELNKCSGQIVSDLKKYIL